jgi:hypothetical protein
MPLRLVLLSCVLAAAGCALAAATPPAGFRAGAATSNLTPPLGTPIVGGFAPFPAQDVHDELHARCLVLDDGRTRLALVICDLLGLHHAVSAEARRLIEETTGIPPSHVLVAGTHTHSAGSALGASRFNAEQPLDDYQRFVATRVADGVRRALNALRPAELGFGTVDIPEHVHNRRWVMREGKAPPNPFGQVDKVKMNPAGGSPDLVEPAGPIDPTVSFLALREPGSGALISVFAAYSLHYVGGVGSRSISADYFGVFCGEIERLSAHPAASRPCVALLANGTSGDINNIDFRLAKRPARKPSEQMNLVGRDVARRVHAALAGISWERAPTLAAAYQELPVAWRSIPAELVAWARETEARAPRVTKGDLPVGAKFATTPDWGHLSVRDLRRDRPRVPPPQPVPPLFHGRAEPRLLWLPAHPTPFRARRLRNVAGDQPPRAGSQRENARRPPDAHRRPATGTGAPVSSGGARRRGITRPAGSYRATSPSDRSGAAPRWPRASRDPRSAP